MTIGFVYCDRPSRSARALAKGLGLQVLGPNSTLPGQGAACLNWGCSRINYPGLTINPPETIRKASNKLLFFQAMVGTDLTPPFYTTSVAASKALSKHKIVCRTILNGHSGAGIVIARKQEQLVDAPLYVQYVEKTDEWRVHVLGGQVIDIQRKARSRSVPDADVNWAVRNHKNGFVYVRGDIVKYDKKVIDTLCQMAIQAVNTVGLDFGAVDLLSGKDGRAYVLEVNTAPGLEGTTLTNYINVFKVLK